MTTAVGSTQTITESARAFSSSAATNVGRLASKSVKCIKTVLSNLYELAISALHGLGTILQGIGKAAKHSGKVIWAHKGSIGLVLAGVAIGAGIYHLVSQKSTGSA